MDDETRAAFARVERWFELMQAQFHELRAEMRQQNEALGVELRQEMREQKEELRREMRELNEALRAESRAEFAAVHAAFAGFGTRLQALEGG